MRACAFTCLFISMVASGCSDPDGCRGTECTPIAVPAPGTPIDCVACPPGEAAAGGVCVARGALRVTALWCSSGDLDLMVQPPEGGIINYNRRGGEGVSLDRDDTCGVGPENVVWESEFPEGTYHVCADPLNVNYPLQVLITVDRTGFEPLYIEKRFERRPFGGDVNVCDPDSPLFIASFTPGDLVALPGGDCPTSDGGPTDGGMDSGPMDAGSDAPADAGADAPSDAGDDAPSDAGDDAGCVAPQVDCGGECVDTQVDLDHCGACGIACSDAETCMMGLCCAVGSTNCGGSCVDTTSDASHCGMCDMACGADESCTESVCCGADGSVCDAMCVDTMSDAMNCGGCGTTCADGELCTDGLCCAAGNTNCGGTCVDTSSDDANCGMCGMECSITSSCVMGSCCDGTICGGTCVDSTSDPANCGGCGNTCEATEACLAGTCLEVRRLEFVAEWDRNGDLDLHVIRPDGVEIYFNNDAPPPGPGGLDGDLDNDSGARGPERVGFDTPTAGDYIACVNNYGGNPSTNWSLRVREDGVEQETLTGMAGSRNTSFRCSAGEAEITYTFTP